VPVIVIYQMSVKALKKMILMFVEQV